MSLDGRYILYYETQPYSSPTPMDNDIKFLLHEIELLDKKDFVILDGGCTLYFEMPKYTLLPEWINKLKADQIFERLDCEMWKRINKTI